MLRTDRVNQWATLYIKASPSLARWLKAAQAARWTSLQEVRQSFKTADGVMVTSGKTATVFNIAGNDFRLITAIHYNRQMIFVLEFLTHSEYSTNRWKDRL